MSHAKGSRELTIASAVMQSKYPIEMMGESTIAQLNVKAARRFQRSRNQEQSNDEGLPTQSAWGEAAEPTSSADHQHVDIESWLNKVLSGAGDRIEFFIEKGDDPSTDPAIFNLESVKDGRLSLNRIGLDKTILRHHGLPMALVERLYRVLYVYTVGFHDITQEIARHCKGANNINGRIWLAFVTLLEECGNGKNYRTALAEANDTYAANLGDLKTAYKDQMVEASDKLNQLHEDISAANDAYAARSQKLKKALNERDMTRVENRALKEELDICRGKLQDERQEVKRWSAKYMRKADEFARKGAKNENLVTQHAVMQKVVEVNKAKAQKETQARVDLEKLYEEKLANLRARLDDVMQRQGPLMSKLAATQEIADLVPVREATIKHLEGRVEKEKGKATAAIAGQAKAEEELRSARTVLQSTKAKLEEETKLTSKLQVQVTTVQRQHDNMKTKCEKVIARNEELTVSNTSLKQQLYHEMLERKNELHMKETALKTIEKLEHKLKETESDLRDTKQRLVKSDKELAAAKKKIGILEASEAGLQEENLFLTEDLTKLQLQNNKDSQTLQKQDKTISEQTIEIREAQKLARRMESDITKKEKQINRMKAKEQEKSREIRTLNKSLGDEKRKSMQLETNLMKQGGMLKHTQMELHLSRKDNAASKQSLVEFMITCEAISEQVHIKGMDDTSGIRIGSNSATIPLPTGTGSGSGREGGRESGSPNLISDEPNVKVLSHAEMRKRWEGDWHCEIHSKKRGVFPLFPPFKLEDSDEEGEEGEEDEEEDAEEDAEEAAAEVEGGDEGGEQDESKQPEERLLTEEEKEQERQRLLQEQEEAEEKARAEAEKERKRIAHDKEQKRLKELLLENGDWLCPSCGTYQFARDLTCKGCHTPYPVLDPTSEELEQQEDMYDEAEQVELSFQHRVCRIEKELTQLLPVVMSRSHASAHELVERVTEVRAEMLRFQAMYAAKVQEIAEQRIAHALHVEKLTQSMLAQKRKEVLAERAIIHRLDSRLGMIEEDNTAEKYKRMEDWLQQTEDDLEDMTNEKIQRDDWVGMLQEDLEFSRVSQKNASMDSSLYKREMVALQLTLSEMQSQMRKQQTLIGAQQRTVDKIIIELEEARTKAALYSAIAKKEKARRDSMRDCATQARFIGVPARTQTDKVSIGTGDGGSTGTGSGGGAEAEPVPPGHRRRISITSFGQHNSSAVPNALRSRRPSDPRATFNTSHSHRQQVAQIYFTPGPNAISRMAVENREAHDVPLASHQMLQQQQQRIDQQRRSMKAQQLPPAMQTRKSFKVQVPQVPQVDAMLEARQSAAQTSRPRNSMMINKRFGYHGA